VATLGQRILWRAVPAGVIAAAVGFGLTWGYIAAIRTMADVDIQTDGPNFLGPLLLGLAGFAMMTVRECVRSPRPPATR
jgi:hypothetical protein